MDRELTQKSDDAAWIGRGLFERSKTSGPLASISFSHNGAMHISRSGSCLDILEAGEFAVMDMNGTSLSGSKPSKKWPLYLKIYQKKPGTGVVIHIHSTYGTPWSLVSVKDETGVIPDHTPHLRMRLGKVGLISYEKPGSQALFDAFEQRVMDSDGYLLKQHRVVAPGEGLIDISLCPKELEGSARIAWMLRRVGMR